MILDSNRKGHLFAANITGLMMAGAGLLTVTPWLIASGIAVPLYEKFCSPDMDHKSRKIKGDLFKRLWLIYWSPFKLSVPHRSRWSHSLLFGTPLRFVYFLFPFLGVGAILVAQDAELASTVSANPWVLVQWSRDLKWLAVAAIASDITHLWKDNFSLIEMIFGK